LVLWASAAGGRGSLWIFIHGTDIVDRGLKVLLFSLFLNYFLVFFPLAPPERGLIVLFFGLLFAIFGLFSVAPPPEKFSADTLAWLNKNFWWYRFFLIRCGSQDI